VEEKSEAILQRCLREMSSQLCLRKISWDYILLVNSGDVRGAPPDPHAELQVFTCGGYDLLTPRLTHRQAELLTDYVIMS